MLSGESAARMANASEIVFVVPPDGMPLQTSLVLADAIAAEIRDSDHPAILARAPNQAGASVVGAVASAVPRDRVTWMIIDWSIRAPYGTLVSTYRQQIVVDTALWQQGAVEVINLVVDDAARNVVNMVHAYVGPPSATAMNHARFTEEPEPAKAPEPEAMPEPQMTTMEQRQLMAEESAPAPVPMQQGPLARISDGTNGQVVHADGLQGTAEPAPLQTTPAAQMAAPTELPSLLSGGTVDSAEVSAPQPAINTTPQPAMNPAPLPAMNPAPLPAATAPRALTPGTQIVQPPPGGVPEPEDDGLLSNLSPNMDSDTRRPGDARPAGPGGAAFAPVRWGQPAFLIKPVVGAPGNGNEALTAALKSALRDRDLTISEDPRQAGFVIQGNVDAGQPVNGRQYVRINWLVSTVTGEEVGKAVQENTVVAGSLDGEWGRVAEVVSHAAVRGIQDLFGEADDTRRQREILPDFPDVKLPQIPGRAPPPPSSL